MFKELRSVQRGVHDPSVAADRSLNGPGLRDRGGRVMIEMTDAWMCDADGCSNMFSMRDAIQEVRSTKPGSWPPTVTYIFCSEECREATEDRWSARPRPGKPNSLGRACKT